MSAIRSRPILVAVSLGFAVFTASIVATPIRDQPAAEPPPLDSYLPYVSWMGADTRRAETGFILISDDDSWNALWKSHLGKGIEADHVGYHSSPQVDFQRCLAVAYFRGDTVNREGEFVTAIDEFPDSMRIRFDSATFQTMSLNPGDPDHGVKARTWGIWIVPRKDKEIVIEENTQGLIGEPPVWKERSRFTAAK